MSCPTDVHTPRRHGGDPEDTSPKSVHTLDQVVAQAARLGWTGRAYAARNRPARRAVAGISRHWLCADPLWRGSGEPKGEMIAPPRWALRRAARHSANCAIANDQRTMPQTVIGRQSRLLLSTIAPDCGRLTVLRGRFSLLAERTATGPPRSFRSFYASVRSYGSVDQRPVVTRWRTHLCLSSSL